MYGIPTELYGFSVQIHLYITGLYDRLRMPF